jgi:hypothetical protein
VLLYDHRNLGGSDGEPRQEVNVWAQARGYRDAISFLTTRPEIDTSRIAVWGDSLSAAEVIVVGAVDSRVRAVVAQIPACGPQVPTTTPTEQQFHQLRDTVESGDITGTPDTTAAPMPVVSADPSGTPSLLQPIQAFRWFIDYGGRPNSQWQNKIIRAAPATPIPFSAWTAAPFLKADLLMMIAPDDEIVNANPAVSRAVFDLVPGWKRCVEIDGGHFGLLYHPSERFDLASRVQTDFLGERLGG